MPSARAMASAPRTRSEPVSRRPARKSVTATVIPLWLFFSVTEENFLTARESGAVEFFERPPAPLPNGFRARRIYQFSTSFVRSSRR